MGDSEKRSCAACNQQITGREAIVVCSSCNHPYHLGCWEQKGKCDTFGCEGRPIYHPVAETPEMRCPYCSGRLAPDEKYCQSCGRKVQERNIGWSDPNQAQTYRAADTSNHPNYLIWAILATIFCCWPFGIVAIVYAAQVNSLAAAGNYAAAQRSSEAARKWCLAATLSGAAVILVYVIIFGLSFVTPTFLQ